MEAVQKNPKESIASHREKTHARNLHSSTLIAIYANTVDRWRFINFRRNVEESIIVLSIESARASLARKEKKDEEEKEMQGH